MAAPFAWSIYTGKDPLIPLFITFAKVYQWRRDDAKLRFRQD